MKLAKKFTFTVVGDESTLYTAEVMADNENGYIVSWDDEYDAKWDTSYDKAAIQEYIVRGFWIVKGVITPVDDAEVINTTPLPVEWMTSMEGEWAITLSEIREFSKETGSVVAVEDEFFVISLNDEIRYVVQTEEELREAMDAIRALDKFVDRG